MKQNSKKYKWYKTIKNDSIFEKNISKNKIYELKKKKIYENGENTHPRVYSHIQNKTVS